MIIEVNGAHHYVANGFNKTRAEHFNSTPEKELSYVQWKDEYKKQYALSQGYHYLAIPYWTENDESYKTLIDDAIKSILTILKHIL